MDFKEIRKKYSWVGFCFFIFGLATELSSIAMKLCLGEHLKSLRENSWAVYGLGLAPIWIVGFPICVLLASRAPSVKPEEHEIKLKYMIQFYIIIYFLMMSANILGTILISITESSLGITIENSTIELIQKQKLLPSFIFTVILGPICEEMAYRKVLIDKLGQYNKRYAILLSGIMFGLFHTNLHQFFYATMIGFVFAYIYSISGRIRYSIILHMTFNFINGFIPMMLIKHMDIEAIEELSGQSTSDPEVMEKLMEFVSNPAFALFLLYMFVLFVVWIAGLILFIMNVKRMRVNDTNSPLPIGTGRSVAFINVGMILFTVLMVVITIIEIVSLNL
jgi:CAAX amino terminal protease family.